MRKTMTGSNWRAVEIRGFRAACKTTWEEGNLGAEGFGESRDWIFQGGW